MKTEIAKIVTAFAEYYGKSLTPNQIVMYTEDLSCLSADELHMACILYRKDPENVFFPLPAQLIGYINPKITATDEANEVANLIINAIGSCGWNNPERARKEIGELGWAVVNKLSNWQHLCQNTYIDDTPILRAQIRGLVEVVSKRAMRGELDDKPSLPSPNNITKLIGSTLKGIE